MMIFTHISTATRQLLANKGKAALTMLGVVIGIGSVISIMTLGEIAKSFLLSQISQFGTNVIEVAITSDFGPFGGDSDLGFTNNDVEAIKESSLLPEVVDISAGYSVTKSVAYRNEEKTASIYGDTTAYFTVNNFKVLHGSLYSESDIRNASRVMVVEENYATDTFGKPENAVDKEVTVDGTRFTIVGVIESVPGNAFGSTMVYIPITTLRNLYVPAEDKEKVSFMLIEFEQGTDAKSFENRLRFEIERIKKLDDTNKDAVYIASREQFLEIFDSILLGIQMFVAAIAAISLIVGGIGIMNIMLVTVQERTKEIGLRKAVGAKNSSILTQFLIEAIVLTTLGGVIGIGFGLSIAASAVLLVNAVQPDWGLQFVFVPSAIVIACGVSITTGIIFGLYPAWKASRLHPIESLRYE